MGREQLTGDVVSAQRRHASIGRWMMATLVLVVFWALSGLAAARADAASGAAQFLSSSGLSRSTSAPCRSGTLEGRCLATPPRPSVPAPAARHSQSLGSGLAGPAIVTGEIEGTVTAAIGAAVLPGIEVCAVPAQTVLLIFERGECAETEAGGKYDIEGLAEGEWKVSFAVSRFLFDEGQNFAPQYWDNSLTLAEAQPVKVIAGKATTEINAAMRPGAEISGKVTWPADETESAEVCAEDVDAVFEIEPACVNTKAHGDYTIPSLAGGHAYAVGFFDVKGFASQLYDDQSQFLESTLIDPQPETTEENIDATLHPGGTIEGHVLDAQSKAGIAKAEVCPVNTAGEEEECAETEAGGFYELEGLPTGSYSVDVEAEGYVTQFYAGQDERFAAASVPVSGGMTVNGVDFALTHGAKISGTVLSGLTHAPLPEVEVCAFDLEIDQARGLAEDCNQSGSEGQYTLEELPPGSYSMSFRPGDGSEYAGQDYNGRSSFLEEEYFPVPAEADLAGMGATLALGGNIAGTVTAAEGGGPVPDVRVCAYLAVAEYEVECTEDAADGTYALHGLPAGQYRLQFVGDDEGFIFEPLHQNQYAFQFSGGASSFAASTPVTVSSGATTSPVNASLSKAASVAGRVTDAQTKLAVSGAVVCAVPPATFIYEGCAVTDDTGHYILNGLQGGQYVLAFEATGFVRSIARLQPQFSGGVSNSQAAVPITVPAAGHVTGANAVLATTKVPVSSELPSVLGRAEAGQTLGEEHAEWLNGVSSFASQWERCNAAGGGCAEIPGANARRYTVTGADAGHTLRVREVAINAHGQSPPDYSQPTLVVPAVPAGPPAEGSRPAETGKPKTTLPSAAKIIHALLAALIPQGKGARIAALRHKGAYSVSFAAPSAGTLTISWYRVPKGAHVSRAKPVLIATGHAVATKAGRITVKIRLTVKGKALLRHSRRVKLTAKGTFKPAGGRASSAVRSFTLH